MRKNIIITLAAVLACGTAMAGGLNTNTNVNAHFLRFFTQDANVTLTSLHANPAGSAFLTKGWHFSIHNQTVVQQRNITTTFPYFAYNQKPGWATADGTHRYEGKAFAPVVPAIGFSYNSGKKWSINGELCVVGGGGACEFLDGIGSFESLYASRMMSSAGTVANAVNAAYGSDYRPKGYTLNSYMKGSNYMFGLQVGATYQVLDNLSLYFGLRGVYATGNYNGYVQDANIILASESGTLPNYTYKTGTDLSMNCDQTGFGVTPVLGIHWYINKHWNIAAKYEFKTKIRMENTTRMNDYTLGLVNQYNPDMTVNTNYSPALANFKNDIKVPDDIPGYLAIGAQYSPKENIHIGLAYHWFQDTSANKGLTQAVNPITGMPEYNADGTAAMVDKRDLINHDTHEVLAGIEWMCHKRLTVSASWQKTMYGVSDQYMNDVSFCCSSNSLGCGVRIHASRLFNIDLGYMHTFYQDRTVSTLVKTDVYNRHNDVIGVGLNFAW